MSTELINYCITKLQKSSRALTIHQPLDSRTRTVIKRYWSKAKFEAQQESIIRLDSSDPLYGRGFLWPYKLEWSETLDSLWNLRIIHAADQPSPRELILLASVSEEAHHWPFSRTIFRTTKTRMLGKERNRRAGSVLPALRPAVANVLLTTNQTSSFIKTWDMTSEVTEDF